jgi:hypothetical protein
MGSNSMQGMALLVFLAGFTCLGTAMLFDGSIPLLLLGAVGVAASIPLFQKAKSME